MPEHDAHFRRVHGAHELMSHRLQRLSMRLQVLFTVVLLHQGADATVDTACGEHYHSGATTMLKQTSKEGFGIIWVAHHGDVARHQHFTQLAISSAETYKISSPRVPRAFLTSFPGGQSVVPGAILKIF